MKFTRRGFLKLSSSIASIKSLNLILSPNKIRKNFKHKLKESKVINTICCYCAVQCGFKIYVKNNKVLHLEGDNEHPVSRGQSCPKGGSLIQLVNSPNRILKPLYRAAGADKWKEVEWDWIFKKIAKKVKDTRDKTFKIKNSHGNIVNRTDGIAHYGGGALDNEECYLLQKWLRSLGLIYMESQSRP
jgi:formate dehydrogenase major subunit